MVAGWEGRRGRFGRLWSRRVVFGLPADRPDEPLETAGYDIHLAWGGWSGSGTLSRKRIYLRPREDECRFTVELPGYAKVELAPVRVHPDDETVVDVYLTPE